jgi:hypothetical protein
LIKARNNPQFEDAAPGQEKLQRGVFFEPAFSSVRRRGLTAPFQSGLAGNLP